MQDMIDFGRGRHRPASQVNLPMTTGILKDRIELFTIIVVAFQLLGYAGYFSLGKHRGLCVAGAQRCLGTFVRISALVALLYLSDARRLASRSSLRRYLLLQ